MGKTAFKIIIGMAGLVAASIGAGILKAKHKEVAYKICEVAHIDNVETQEKVANATKTVAKVIDKVTTVASFVAPIVALRAVVKIDKELNSEKTDAYYDVRTVEDTWEEIVPTSFCKAKMTKYKDCETPDLDIDADFQINGDELQNYYQKWKKYVPEDEWKFRKESF